MLTVKTNYGFVTDSLNQFLADSQAFILMGAVIYIIATIFKKGIEIQDENDLTVNHSNYCKFRCNDGQKKNVFE